MKLPLVEQTGLALRLCNDRPACCCPDLDLSLFGDLRPGAPSCRRCVSTSQSRALRTATSNRPPTGCVAWRVAKPSRRASSRCVKGCWTPRHAGCVEPATVGIAGSRVGSQPLAEGLGPYSSAAANAARLITSACARPRFISSARRRCLPASSFKRGPVTCAADRWPAAIGHRRHSSAQSEPLQLVCSRRSVGRPGPSLRRPATP